MDMSYVSCSYRYHLPWTLPRWACKCHLPHLFAKPFGVFLWWELVQSAWSLLSGLQERLGTASKGLLCWEVASFWRERHITEMIRHVSCKILPESWQITASIFFELLNTCSTAAESPMPLALWELGDLPWECLKLGLMISWISWMCIDFAVYG